MASLNIVSLNCHGYNSGTAAYLQSISVSADIIFLQETRFSDISYNRNSELMSDYALFHTSTVEDKLSLGHCSGRPFGVPSVCWCMLLVMCACVVCAFLARFLIVILDLFHWRKYNEHIIMPMDQKGGQYQLQEVFINKK